MAQLQTSLIDKLISYEGITTANGAPGGTTLIDTILTTKPDYNGNLLVIQSGTHKGQAADINGTTLLGTVTPHTPFGGVILAGTSFTIYGIRAVPAEVAALMADVGDASASALGSIYDILDDPAQSYLAMIGYEGATSLADKLTAIRAGYLDLITPIFDIVNAILTLTETGGTLTTDGTEQDIYINNAPAGVFSPKIIQLDFTNQTAGETVVIREYYRISSVGALIKKDEVTFAGVQDPLLRNVTLEPNRFGIQVTIEKTAGTNRAYPWEAIYKI